MRPSPSEAQALVKLLTSIYEEIRAVEIDYAVRVSEGDMRPRIEYFHDAVRAYTSGDAGSRRLSVEHLAHDLSWLRHIQAHPLAMMKTARGASPKTTLVPHGHPAGAPRRPDRDTRTQLAERYKQYTVIFSALLAEKADRDYKTRIEEHDSAVEDVAQLQQMIELVAKGQAKMEDLEQAIEMIDDDTLRQKIALMMHDYAQRKRFESEQFIKKLKEAMAEHDRAIAALEQAHFSYATSQLMVFEESKEMVKNLAGQGLNLAGKFLANAVQEAGRGGRGR